MNCFPRAFRRRRSARKISCGSTDRGRANFTSRPTGSSGADNPMFSSIKLGDSWLNLFDIFNLQLGAELTVLSACETGMSAVWEGDELLGLARGFLYAGTPRCGESWTVNDRSTASSCAAFMKAQAALEGPLATGSGHGCQSGVPSPVLLGSIPSDGTILSGFARKLEGNPKFSIRVIM